MRIPLQLQPGFALDDTTFSQKGRWNRGDKIRWWRGLPQTIGGWESFIGETLNGVCRSVFNWTDNTPAINSAFGTHLGLQLVRGGGMYDITPAPTQATATITVVSEPAADETFTLGGQTFTFKASRSASGEVTIDADTTTQAENIVTAINADQSDVTASNDENVVTLTVVSSGFAGNATTLSESIAALTVTPFVGGGEFFPGQIDGTGGLGYGTGAYSNGAYSEPSTADYFPLTWSFGNYGQSLMANPREQTIFWWRNDTSEPAIPLPGAPENVIYTLVAQTRQVMAFGCNEEFSGTFNPLCIRFSDVEDPTDWTTATNNLAGEVILDGGGRIVAAQQIGNYINVWTDNALYLGQFTGSVTQPWRFDKMGEHCGLIGPNAAVVVGQRAFWIAPNMQFYGASMGGEPQLIHNPVQVEFSDNLAATQVDKIVAASVSEFNEVWWFYPDSRDGNENSRYFSLSFSDNVWGMGVLPRTAFIDAQPTILPVGVTADGIIYYHERGCSADGNAFSWYMETADQYLGEADSILMIKGIWPDFLSQSGPVSLTLKTRLYPQGRQREHGPYTMGPSTRRRDFRAQGRIVQMRISGESSPTFCRIGKPEIEVAQRGLR